MPLLDFIGKSDVLNHHTKVPVRLLHEEPQFSCTSDNENNDNLIVEGDNLEALRALLPRYGGQVKCIYIDPPYNTGNEGWAYNDNVNAPTIKQWLTKTVGRDDLSRHDKWLCMMLPRLKLLREFLRNDGAIFISIDDNEVHHLRCLLDEVFGEQNFVTSVIWQRTFAAKNDAKYFSTDHEYLLVFALQIENFHVQSLARGEKQNARYANPDNDPRGAWTSTDLLRMEHRENSIYKIIAPNTGKEWIPKPGTSWRHPEDEMLKLIANHEVTFGSDGNSKPRRKRFLTDVKQGIVPQTLWKHEEVGHTQEAKQLLKNILELSTDFFATPKPPRLISQILQIASDPDSIILDSFAGSGTTAQAVLELNKQDGGRRRFVLVEMEQEIARNITAERVRRVASGYTDAKGKQVEGTGGGFRFMRLGEALFDESGAITPGVRFGELAQYVFFYETGVPFQEPETQATTPLLGIVDGKAVVLLYNGILKDKTAQGGNALTRETLSIIQASIEAASADAVFAGRIIVYGTSCRLSEERLREAGIVFKQIPYSLHFTTNE